MVKAPRRSAGLLPLRLKDETLQFFLVHPGGPFFRKKDAGAWSIAKGLVQEGEDPLAAAEREWMEETGLELPKGPYFSLGEVPQKSKIVCAWAVAADCDPTALVSNTFEIEWPPRSGRRASFPEVDRAEWFDEEQAQSKILPAQAPFLERAKALAPLIFSKA